MFHDCSRFFTFFSQSRHIDLECCAALWCTPALLQQLPPTSLCIHGSRESTLDLSHAVEFLSCTQSCTRNYELFLHEIFSYEIFSIAIYGIISLHISLHYSQSSLATLKLGVASSRVALQLWPLSLHGWIGCCHMHVTTLSQPWCRASANRSWNSSLRICSRKQTIRV